ncbi:hypothetical protein B5S28_g3503 [[Candida] boidinii]|nr:hypothetical protein B5S28_g3503 [[Candida] boidinii]OWB59160.1 hypothetical protein B5S29_g14 [[Candida] boidinii]OWB70459.1 hypothetical protein B5S31_g137 [[Candida] boidinii]OWB75879.1 hypothetical protein B5S32_g26 [[Candida] boidinii]GME90093.1 unnamed protein product [[Candida] boidinii]
MTTLSNDNSLIAYPAVSITYCVKCKWQLRASWYLQEILQTFSSSPNDKDELSINSVSLAPSCVAGTFKVLVQRSKDEEVKVIWDRKTDGGFPDSKTLKQRIKNYLYPELNLNHIDKPSSNGGILVEDKQSKPITISSSATSNNAENFTQECIDCCKTWEG